MTSICNIPVSYTHLDVYKRQSYISRNHGYMVYDTLFSVDSKGQVKPQMVDTFTLSPDRKKYTFTLRQGLKWHDGAPVTAADCVASIRRWGAKDVSGTLLMRELASVSYTHLDVYKRQGLGPPDV